MRLCAIIPAFNEQASIGVVARQTRQYVDEVVVVDDGSVDQTAHEAEAAGVTCLRLAKNQGKGAAMRAGLEWALARDFDWLLFLDGDGQHRPQDIPSLIHAASQSCAEMVIGVRNFDLGRMPRHRFLSNSLGSRVASLLVGRPIRDSQCGFRLVRADALRRVRLRGRKYEIEMEILIKLIRNGARVEHAPVQLVYTDRKATSKMKPVRDTVRICFWSLFFRYLNA